jgi:hypothetical protein
MKGFRLQLYILGHDNNRPELAVGVALTAWPSFLLLLPLKAGFTSEDLTSIMTLSYVSVTSRRI